jgi:TonB family protein
MTRRATLLILALALSPAFAAAQTRTTFPENGPFTAPPELLNRDEAAALAKASYPDELERAGLAGTPTVRLYIDETGAVRTRRIERSSALAELDSAALKVADAMRFSPARNGDQPTHLWVTIPVTFRIDLPPVPTPATPPRTRNLYDVELALGNMLEDRVMKDDRPPVVAIYVTKDGMPEVVELREPSGDHNMDAAAIRSALTARFDPARDAAGQPIESWILVTIRRHFRR